MSRDHVNMQNVVNVVDSNEILILCGRCGNRMTKVAMKQMMQTIPIDQIIVRSN